MERALPPIAWRDATKPGTKRGEKTIICRILRRRKRRQKQKLRRKQTTQRAERKKETEMKLFRDLWKEHLLFSSYESWDSVRRRRCRSEAEREEDLLLRFPWEIQSEEFETQRLGRVHVFRLVSTRAAARTRRPTLRCAHRRTSRAGTRTANTRRTVI